MTPMSKDRLEYIRQLPWEHEKYPLEACLAITDCLNEIDLLTAQLAEQRKEIETLQTRNNELSNIGYSDAWKIGDLKKEIEELRKQVDELSATLRRTAKSV